MSDVLIVKVSNVEKKRSQMKIMILNKILSLIKTFDVTIDDFFL